MATMDEASGLIASQSIRVQSITGLLEYKADDMPMTRNIMPMKAAIVIRYEDEEASTPELVVCAHDNCRNNPASLPPFNGDCTPNSANAGMPPCGARKVLLHSCCAPCSGAMMEEMLEKGLEVTVFFYNPNIHPKLEYEIRKEENKRYALARGVPFVDCDYDQKSWFDRMAGLEYDPERGLRCSACFDMRMEVTAAYAAAHGFPCFTTTNATSRWKDVQQVNTSGIRAEEPYEGSVRYWAYNWQTDGMTLRKYHISAEQRFYKQEYCGCSYSLRDSNLWRKNQGIPPVKIGGEVAGLGTRYFEDPEADAAEESQEVVDAFFSDAAQQFGNERLRKQFQGRHKSVAEGALNNW